MALERCLLSVLHLASLASLDGALPACGTGGCGECLPPDNATTPNVLLVGDSISMGSYGYAWYARELLSASSSGLATVQHAGGFGGGGQFASVASHLRCFSGAGSTYLSGHHFDVATYNACIHGCCKSSENVTDTDYKADMRLVLTGLAAHSAHVLLVTTTPVSYKVSQPPSTIGAGCIEHRNILAKQVVSELSKAGKNISVSDMCVVAVAAAAACGYLRVLACACCLLVCLLACLLLA